MCSLFLETFLEIGCIASEVFDDLGSLLHFPHTFQPHSCTCTVLWFLICRNKHKDICPGKLVALPHVSPFSSHNLFFLRFVITSDPWLGPQPSSYGPLCSTRSISILSPSGGFSKISLWKFINKNGSNICNF